MASPVHFQCDQCGYETQTIAGRDVMMMGKVEPAVCRGCREIQILLVESRGPEKVDDRCPDCRSKAIKRRPASHPCPRCGESMGEGEPWGIAD